jgi:hypothetical protein
LDSERPFQWCGVFELEPGQYKLIAKSTDYEQTNICIMATEQADPETVRTLIEPVVSVFRKIGRRLVSGKTFAPAEIPYQLIMKGEEALFELNIEQSGAYALFSQHRLEEVSLKLVNSQGHPIEPAIHRTFKQEHRHQEDVTSVGISTSGDLDLNRFQDWLRELLATKGPDLFRLKGILSFKGMPERYIFQGIHMLFDGRPDRPWGKEPRKNALVFIGRNLDRSELNAGFESCLT